MFGFFLVVFFFFPLFFPLFSSEGQLWGTSTENKVYSSYAAFGTDSFLISQVEFDAGRTKVRLAWLWLCLPHTRYNAATLWLLPLCSAAHTPPVLSSCQRSSQLSLQGGLVTLQLSHCLVGGAIQPYLPPQQAETKNKPLCQWSSIASPLCPPVACLMWHLVLPTKTLWAGREGVGMPNFNPQIDTTCFYPPLQILIEVADDFGARKMYSGHTFLNIFSLYCLSGSRSSLFFITVPFFLISFLPLRKRKTHTHKNTAGQEIKPLHKDDLVRCWLFTHLFCTDYFL